MDTLKILAGSNSISDYAEKVSRKETAQKQVATSARNVRETKKQLESQKLEVERIIADQKTRQEALDAKRSEQQAFVNKYRDDQNAYLADAKDAQKIKDAEILRRQQDIIANDSSGSSGRSDPNFPNTFPYRGVCPGHNLSYLVGSAFGGNWGYVCQCVSYTGWKAYEYTNGRINPGARYNPYLGGYRWGDAKHWAASAAALGYNTGYEPRANSIAVTTGGTWGHVMWVEAVNPNGTITLSEYNYSYTGDYNVRYNASPAGKIYIYMD